MLDVDLAAMRRLVEGRDYRPLFVTVIGDMRCGGRGVLHATRPGWERERRAIFRVDYRGPAIADTLRRYPGCCPTWR